jgi:dTDP-L-rhamnose 4-epimerase
MNETLIVGGAGFIGSQIVRELGIAGLTVFDNLSPVVHNAKSISEFVGSGVDFVAGDTTQPTDVEDLLGDESPENLILLAAETGTGRSLYNCVLNTRVNAIGTALILDTLGKLDRLPRRIVLTSSRAVYGEGPYADPSGQLVYPSQRSQVDLESGQFEFPGLSPLAMDGSVHMPNPSNIYGSTKLCQENLVRNWARSYGVDAYVLRLQNVYGAGQSLTNPYTGVLIHFLRMLETGNPVSIYEGGGITRDFVHVSDVVQAISATLKADGAAGTYDIGSGERVTLEDVAAQLCELKGGAPPEFCDRFRLGDVRHAAADIEAARRMIGYAPKISLRDGLAGLIDFFDKD